jgi:hypothetical protein
MSWDAISAIAESLGALAVLATLLYLTVQIKQSRLLLEENRKIALSQIYETRTQRRIEQSNRIGDPYLAELTVKLRGGYMNPHIPEEVAQRFDSLSEVEKLVMYSKSEANMLNIDNSLYQSSLGLFDDIQSEHMAAALISNRHFWTHIKLRLTPRIEKWYEKNDPEEKRITTRPEVDR